MTHINRTDILLFLFFIFCGFLWTGFRLSHGSILLPSLYMMFIYFVLAPVSEELFFRGFLQNAVKKRLRGVLFGISVANILTSVIFSLVHIFGWGLEHGLMVFAPSLAMGILYDRTGRVSFAILLHSIYNLNAAVV